MGAITPSLLVQRIPIAVGTAGADFLAAMHGFQISCIFSLSRFLSRDGRQQISQGDFLEISQHMLPDFFEPVT